jgi:hypothetical protein
MKRFLMIATACFLALVISSNIADAAKSSGSRGGSVSRGGGASRASASRGGARSSTSRGSANHARGGANKAGAKGGKARKSTSNRAAASKARKSGKANLARNGAGKNGKAVKNHSGNNGKTNLVKNGAGKNGTQNGNLAKNGKSNRKMPRAVQNRARSRGYDFARSWFSLDFGTTLFGDNDGDWYYWYAPFDSYLSIDFIDIYSPDDGDAVAITTSDPA